MIFLTRLGLGTFASAVGLASCATTDDGVRRRYRGATQAVCLRYQSRLTELTTPDPTSEILQVSLDYVDELRRLGRPQADSADLGLLYDAMEEGFRLLPEYRTAEENGDSAKLRAIQNRLMELGSAHNVMASRYYIDRCAQSGS